MKAGSATEAEPATQVSPAAATREDRQRWALQFKGVVQGVGFRPHVFRLARDHHLAGWVLNSARGVTIEVEGRPEGLGAFLDELLAHPPRLAHIDWWDRQVLAPAGYGDFVIRESREDEEKEVLVSPDVAICPDCRGEIFDAADRRYHYPFTNCTNCGPRFTIIEDVPYDREKTTMRVFPMCPDCGREYHDPTDRRFHAQPVACPQCGPEAWLVDAEGRPVGTGDQWLPEVRRLLGNGAIVALKGLGGFHLACDAPDEAAVARLRQRKRRPAKPFAVMARNPEVIRGFARLSAEEEQLLRSPAAPIVIVDRLPGEGRLAASIAPGLGSVGVMIPYTPLHALIFGEGQDGPRGEAPDILVMTSGNVSDLPLVKDNAAALAELGTIADYFLLHNRDIRHRCDDSVVRVVGGEAQFVRRSRGYVPQPLTVPGPPVAAADDRDAVPVILGAGAAMKNTFCLLRGERAFLSPHIGEVAFREGLAHYRDALETMESLVFATAGAVAYDLHPGYQISALARELRPGPAVGVQHHHAHLAALMADNGLTGEIVGIIADGTGYGQDGTIWGGEILVGGYRDFRRALHLAPVRLPGGDRAVVDPMRLALAHLMAAYGPEEGLAVAEGLFPGRTADLRVAARLVATGFNSPWASSCGRLFDAASALLGIADRSTYEGQAAVELAESAETAGGTGATAPRPEPFPVEMRGDVLETAPIIRGLVAEVQKARLDRLASDARRQAAARLASRFQETVTRLLVRGAVEAARQSGLTRVGLSGGVFQNRALVLRCREELRRVGLDVYCHRHVPPNDGGLALGQAVVARWRLAAGR
ncbi:MAG: carbamoyltransferase HypF [Bacillota bacterium]